MTADGATDVDVVVVGCGPTGAVLAHLLALSGVRVLVLEREAGVLDLPRAVHFDAEAMRVFQTIGVAESVARKARVNPGMRFVDADGRLLLDWPRPPGVGPQGWQASWRFHQPDLETALREGFSRRPSLETRGGCAVEDVEAREDAAEARFTGPDGRTRRVTARHVVGCDGARSAVRRIMAATSEDLGFHERWLVADLRLTRDRPDLGDVTVQHCDPGRPATYVRGPGDRRRWEIRLDPGEDAADMLAPAALWRLLKRWVAPDEAQVERAAVYEFHSILARGWRRGRLMIAGDAAHQTPPFLGQGMCAGVRDAANLAWKLALHLEGRADDALLDTYESERRPHARAYVETAIRLGGLINASGTEEALRAALRGADGSARMESIAPRLGPGLHDDDDPAAGWPAAQPVLADGRRLDDATGYAPALLTEDALLAGAGDAPARIARAGAATLRADAEPGVAAMLRDAGARALLVRPDRNVLGTARDAAGLSALADRLPGCPAR